MEAKFTPTVKDIIQYSREAALAHGNDFINCTHLVLGILRDNQNSAKTALTVLNVDLEKLKQLLIKSLPEGNGKQLVGSIPLTKQAEKALKITYLEAKVLNSSSINSAHLLLSILRDEDNEASQALMGFKVNYEVLKRAVEKNDLIHRDEAIEKDVVTREIKPIVALKNVSPISLLFDRSEYTEDDIKNIILTLSELYSHIGGDYLQVTGMNQFERNLFLA
jgi:ATP-dependent Clp protease ATP-binding subunit ClpA